MSKDCILEIQNEVRAKFIGLDINTRRKLHKELEFMLPYARHTPSFKMGRWSGKVSFCDIGGRTYVNVLDRLLPHVIDAGYTIEIKDQRPNVEMKFEKVQHDSYSHIIWPEGHRFAGEPVTLMDHQVESINAYLENTQSIQVISTGAGKTILTAILCDRAEQYGRTITIVPNRDLVTQTEEDFINFGLDVGVYYGGRKEFGKQHTICTWQGLEALDKKSKDPEVQQNLLELIDGVCTVIVDECHSGKGPVLQKHLSTHFSHCPIRWGMTGTMPKEDYESLGIICNLGNVVNRVKAKDLQELGILADLHINIKQYQEPFVEFKSYPEELKWLTTNKDRLMEIASDIRKQCITGNTLILVDRIECGELLMDYLPDATFINGSVSSKNRKEEYKEVNSVNNKIIIATYGVAAVGINIPRIFNLYMIEPGKSFIRVIQTIGRGIRKAEDKDFVNIFDITSSTKYSKKHLTERKKFYKENEYPFTLERIKYDKN